MRIRLPAIVLLVAVAAGHARAAPLSEPEAAFLEHLVTAGTVLEQRCPRYEANGTGGVQYGARLLGSPSAAMAMINAYAAAIMAQDSKEYDPAIFRSEVTDMTGKLTRRLRAELIRNPENACALYGEASAARGLLRRY